MKYNPKSSKAEEFINHEEIEETLLYAIEHKEDRELIESILKKAREFKGISHREAAVLLECEIEEYTEEIKKIAMEVKEKFYGNRIVMFAPLYLSNYCINGCTYCPYHGSNKHIARKKLTQEEIIQEVIVALFFQYDATIGIVGCIFFVNIDAIPFPTYAVCICLLSFFVFAGCVFN